MKYVRFYGGNGYCGCDYEDFMAFEDNITDQELDEMSYELAIQNAESFEYVATGWDEDFESEDDRAMYYEDATGDWEFISQEEFEENCG